MRTFFTFLLRFEYFVIITGCIFSIVTGQIDLNWWKNSVIYEIYPKSFKDSDGDGIGDIQGIISKLEHVKESGANVIWLSPFSKIDLLFDENYNDLIRKAKMLGLKILLEFIPNHTSKLHEWFQNSRYRIEPFSEYYIWKDAKQNLNGSRIPPNNWLSVSGGSAWEWDEYRKQYYYHAFDVNKPDLNYRNPRVRKSMEDIISYWLDLGIDGLKIDVVNHIFEDEQSRDEPRSEDNVPPNDYKYLSHIYTKDLNETYMIVQDWKNLLDNYANKHKTDAKIIFLEASTDRSHLMKYYDVGANPFNFMFISTLNNNSKAQDFKTNIDEWIAAVPKNKVPNWIVGKHDQHRVASRYGWDNNRADQITMLSIMLPGSTVIYNGDEIGMVDRFFTFEETRDLDACNAGPEKYQLISRDPERTPYQWDNSTSAGFSSFPLTWLPVNSNYITLNLAAQKQKQTSHYKVFQELTKLKKTRVLQDGTVEVHIMRQLVLAIVRRLDHVKTVVLLINFDFQDRQVDLTLLENFPPQLKIIIASVKSGVEIGKQIDSDNIVVPAAASVIYIEN